ncbi:MAG TPA: peptide chain release factor N(5)-glutamine methyltransferase [Steroidobacteraceae bacterium]|nr:peptide chain release factor N(5)-glutamine methyltransferase [Steroidobacteraceae bacterium]
MKQLYVTTISDALHTATLLLARSSASARLDAELLLEHVTGLSRTDFRAAPERELPAAAGWSFQQLIRRRLQGEPVAYIRGEQEFWSLLLEVSPAVLIPRPETELVVERALALLGPDAQQAADLGTGSGAIALAIANERPSLQVTGVDISGDALEIARRNAARLQLRNVRFERGSWFAPLAGRRFDVVAANPPYVARGDTDLAPDVIRFEPETALISGATGLEALEHIVAQAGNHLQPRGWLILEHGWRQAGAVRDRLVRSGFAHVRSHADLTGHERVTEGSIP